LAAQPTAQSFESPGLKMWKPGLLRWLAIGCHGESCFERGLTALFPAPPTGARDSDAVFVPLGGERDRDQPRECSAADAHYWTNILVVFTGRAAGTAEAAPFARDEDLGLPNGSLRNRLGLWVGRRDGIG
jgi:hypothetical protein